MTISFGPDFLYTAEESSDVTQFSAIAFVHNVENTESEQKALISFLYDINISRVASNPSLPTEVSRMKRAEQPANENFMTLAFMDKPDADNKLPDRKIIKGIFFFQRKERRLALLKVIETVDCESVMFRHAEYAVYVIKNKCQQRGQSSVPAVMEALELNEGEKSYVLGKLGGFVPTSPQKAPPPAPPQTLTEWLRVGAHVVSEKLVTDPNDNNTLDVGVYDHGNETCGVLVVSAVNAPNRPVWGFSKTNLIERNLHMDAIRELYAIVPKYLSFNDVMLTPDDKTVTLDTLVNGISDTTKKAGAIRFIQEGALNKFAVFDLRKVLGFFDTVNKNADAKAKVEEWRGFNEAGETVKCFNTLLTAMSAQQAAMDNGGQGSAQEVIDLTHSPSGSPRNSPSSKGNQTRPRSPPPSPKPKPWTNKEALSHGVIATDDDLENLLNFK